ncbi:MAG: heme-binding domain-containing protein [Acidobacteriales bacterium]|nr:heme-binding domain-containing protein [Terriglobales bacterium]
MGKKTKIALLALVVVFVAAQFCQPARTNPPSQAALSFDAVANPTPQVRSILDRACKDCHSNVTVWPWYSHIAPVSWQVADDVRDARKHLNFSEWGKLSPARRLQALGDMCREVNSGDMPLWQYRLLHPAARLQQGDVTALCMLSAKPQ